MPTRKPIEIEEWYHCYNRGVDKRRVFQRDSDYERFLLLMYIANSSLSVHISNLKDRHLHNVLADTAINTGKPIVEIGAYCLMPNHFHFALKEAVQNGISLFMQKVFTGYTMYFNKRYDRTGALFAGTFKSIHIADDRYLKQLISYIHLNPVALFDPDWNKHTTRAVRLERELQLYRYSSLPDYLGVDRLEKSILDTSVFSLFDTLPTIKDMLENAAIYNSEHIEV